MGYAEDVLKLRKRVMDAVSTGVIDNNIKDFYEATLLQILNESERQRQSCMAQAENLEKQAAIARGQANSYAAMGSIIYSVLNGYVMVQERSLKEESDRAAEQREKEEYAKSLEEKKEKPIKKKL